MSTHLTAVSGIGPAAAGLLEKHGIASAEQLAQTTVDALSKVPGFGPARAATVLAAARTALDAPGASAAVAKGEKKKKKKGKKNRKKDGEAKAGKPSDAKKRKKKEKKKDKKK